MQNRAEILMLLNIGIFIKQTKELNAPNNLNYIGGQMQPDIAEFD